MGALIAVFGRPESWRRAGLMAAMLAAVSTVVAGVPAPAQASVEPAMRGADRPAVPTPPVESEPLTAPDAVSAMVIARLEGEPVEVLGERTESSTVYALPDGTIAAGFSSGPEWVRTGGDGTELADWAEVDPTLVVDPNGDVSPVAHPGSLTFAGTAREGTVEDPSVLVTAVSPEGVTSTIAWPGAVPAPRLEGARAVYEEIEPDVDLVIEATATGFEQYFVVKSAEAADGLELPLVLSVDGGEVTESDDGGYAFTDAQGEEVARLNRPGFHGGSQSTEDESHGSTEEVPGRASGASDEDGGRRAA